MENTSPNERLTPGQSQTPAIYPPIAIVRQGPEIPGDLIDNQQPRAMPPQGDKVKRKYYVPVKGKFLISTTLSCVWLYASWLLAQNWLAELADITGYFPAVHGGSGSVGVKPVTNLAVELNVEGGNFAAGSASGFSYFIIGPRILYRF
jgi:hypothetical protein